MKKVVFMSILALSMAACSTEATTEETETVESSEEGGSDKGAELERLSTERDDFYNKHLEALEAGEVDQANVYKAQMDSVDALYQEALRN
jgi:hypothetical protein